MWDCHHCGSCQIGLLDEIRSRVDGLTGLFGKLKREAVEDQAVNNLQKTLEKSKASLSVRMSGQPQAISAVSTEPNWRRWTAGMIQVLLLAFLISAFVALLVLGKYDLKRAEPSSGLSKTNRLRLIDRP